jgi:hypothetical protein
LTAFEAAYARHHRDATRASGRRVDAHAPRATAPTSPPSPANVPAPPPPPKSPTLVVWQFEVDRTQTVVLSNRWEHAAVAGVGLLRERFHRFCRGTLALVFEAAVTRRDAPVAQTNPPM